ncbi:TPA: hypothetical protein DCL94_04385 [candidate division WWE3 bacterium]|uniref:Uncharacterized protein n=1 Tax=candidate division WWE3 bacterium TaxID=2053526 RepID=A0A656PR46_UNCKA|nr:hypothetical protein [candidate division WWE3 bacterium]HBL00475.1 hypothetical protein [candidate division WWE3 bacterium]HBT66130.1 hypothetical protein [candidate division WWE3 bacterium]HCQ40906.1 hypothetical protein [candidate division WWE3 bacterium]
MGSTPTPSANKKWPAFTAGYFLFEGRLVVPRSRFESHISANEVSRIALRSKTPSTRKKISSHLPFGKKMTAF